jgi:hypothetical protein
VSVCSPRETRTVPVEHDEELVPLVALLDDDLAAL